MENHRASFRMKRYKNNLLYQKIDEIGLDHFYIELIEKCGCNDIEELRAVEKNWIRKIGNLNVRVDGRTKEEYYIDKKEQIKNNKSENYYKNREQILQKQKQYNETHKEQKREHDKQRREEKWEEISEKNKTKYANNQEYRKRQKERSKARWENNKEEIKEQHKTYGEKHKLELTQWFQTKVSCPCGGKYTLRNKAQHFQCKKHQDYLNNNIENVSSTQEETDNTELQKTNEQTNRQTIGTGDI